MTLPKIAEWDRAGLSALWAEQQGGTPPKGLSQTLMRRILAFELQAQAHGGIDRKTARALKAMAPDRGATPKPRRNATPRLRQGTRLLREWNGVTHRVDVVEDGFIWQGTTYRSLSAIARAITGAHWSGPRFFGQTAKSNG